MEIPIRPWGPVSYLFVGLQPLLTYCGFVKFQGNIQVTGKTGSANDLWICCFPINVEEFCDLLLFDKITLAMWDIYKYIQNGNFSMLEEDSLKLLCK